MMVFPSRSKEPFHVCILLTSIRHGCYLSTVPNIRLPRLRCRPHPSSLASSSVELRDLRIHDLDGAYVSSRVCECYRLEG